jgi:hypothetical protein
VHQDTIPSPPVCQGYHVHLRCVGPVAPLRPGTSGPSRRSARRFVLLAAAVWVCVAALSSAAYPTPYSVHAPKRLAVMHQHDANVPPALAPVAAFGPASASDSSSTLRGGGIAATFLVGAFDSGPAVRALPAHLRAAVLRPTTREDFGSLHPVTQLLGEGVVLPSRPAVQPPWGDLPPTLTVKVVKREREGASGGDDDAGGSVVRVTVRFDTRAPAWSCLRVTSALGPVLRWSLSPVLPGGGKRGTPLWARHAGNGEVNPKTQTLSL